MCSKNNYCAGDLTDDIVELVDVFPTLTLKTVPGVIEKTVNIRKYQTYAPCVTNPNTGYVQQPENTFYGDGLCDPGVMAFDVKQERKRTGEIVESTIDLTRDVQACPPAECDSRDSDCFEKHLYTNKGLVGCLDTSIEGPATVEFTVRDDSSQITRVVRQFNVIDECPSGYRSCPGFGERDCQTDVICDNPDVISAAVQTVVIDTEAPEFTRFLPTAPLLLEYGVNYLSAGNTPFATCANPAQAVSAASLVASGASATQLPCAMTAYDEGDGEDVTRYIGVTQVKMGTEDFFSLSQHGTGIVPPGQYVYEYSVTDLDENEAKETS